MTDEELDKVLGDADQASREPAAPTVALGAAPQGERGRLTVPGRRTDDLRRCDLLVVREADGSWSFHAPPLGSPGVRLDPGMAVALAESILGRARPLGWPDDQRGRSR